MGNTETDIFLKNYHCFNAAAQFSPAWFGLSGDLEEHKDALVTGGFGADLLIASRDTSTGITFTLRSHNPVKLSHDY